MLTHLTQCFLDGLVAILPISGLIVILYRLDAALDSFLKSWSLPDLPGRRLLVGIIVIYLLGLTVTTVIGQWVWDHLDRLLSHVPGLAMLYNTLKQILGYGSGKDALF